MRSALLFISAIGIASAGCDLLASKVGGSDKPKTIQSTNGLLRIEVPGAWKEDPTLHQQAQLKISSRWKEMYLMVISESKEDFANLDLAGHSQITRKILTGNLKGPVEGGMQEITLDGLPAHQYEIRGTIDGLNIVYVHTTFETADHFHQVVAWTLKSKAAKGLPELKRLTGEIKLVGAKRPSAAGNPPAAEQPPAAQ